MGKTLILIDGHALAFRQFYALERTNMRTSEGVPTWAVYGFFKAVFDLLKNEELKADAIAVAFDVSHKTFRTETYTEYKSNRSAMPDTMREQMGLIYEGLRAFNIPIYTKEGFEADDVIGTISREACELGHKVLILTGDQDAFQLVDKDGCVKVILPYKGELIEYNWDKIFEKLGVYPNQVIDYKGLRGDVSDCIPGVKGIGEKTAQKLLARYGTLDAILENCENIQEKAVKQRICEGKEQAKMSQYLATIVRDLDVDFDFDQTKVELPDVAVVTEYLKKMQFYTFIKNINDILYSFDKVERVAIQQDSPQQLDFFSSAVSDELNKDCEFCYESKLITDSADFENLVNELKKQAQFAFKVFAEVQSAINSIITGFAFAYSDKAFYVPVGHSNIENQLRLEDVLFALRTLFENENIRKTVFDAKGQYNILRNHGILAKGVDFDIMLASYVKDAGRKHELDIQALEHLGHAIAPYGHFDKKNPLKFADALCEDVLNNACDEVFSISELEKFWQNDLDEAELKLVNDVEVPLSVVLADMEYNGVAIDENYLISLTSMMDEELRKIECKVFDIAGCSFNINSPRQVGEILFEKLGLKAKKKRGKSSYSTNAVVLEELAQEYEIAVINRQPHSQGGKESRRPDSGATQHIDDSL